MAGGGDFGVELHGLEPLQTLLQRAGERAPAVMATALYEEMLLVMLESQKQVPVGRTAFLKGSGKVLPPVQTGDTVTITLGYGGAASAYAVYVHNAPHELNWTTPGTKSHFLSDPLKQSLYNIERNLARRIGEMV